jgi:hypothetical protein
LHGFPERLELVRFGPVQVLVLELKLAWADPDVVPLLLLGVEAAEAMHDHRAFDGEAEGVLRGERECLAGVDHRGDGDPADGIWHVSDLTRVPGYGSRQQRHNASIWQSV